MRRHSVVEVEAGAEHVMGSDVLHTRSMRSLQAPATGGVTCINI